jgi:hypothetical protein
MRYARGINELKFTIEGNDNKKRYRNIYRFFALFGMFSVTALGFVLIDLIIQAVI